MKWNVGWGVIPYCNMNCQFCYSNHVRSNPNFSLCKFEEWKNFVDQNHDLIGSINYGTGESTISDDWFKLIAYIRNSYPDIKQALTTNGYLKSIDEVDVSLDFADAEKHNIFRGQPCAYEWAIDTLSYCQHNDIPCTIVFLGTDSVLDINNVANLFEIARKYNTILRTNIFRPTMGINNFSKKFVASYTNILECIYWINEHHKILSISDPLFCSLLVEDKVEIDHSGIDSIRILHDGKITPSTYLITEKFSVGKINESNLKNLSFLENVIPKDCEFCLYVNKCQGGVLDRRYLWFQDFNQRDPYCPFRPENFLPDKKVTLNNTNNFKSVHYGYLPTMFFAPR